MDPNELQEFSYRRGLVLGFTTAEITVLLLFLLLLIMGYFMYNETAGEDELPQKEPAENIGQETGEELSYEILVVQFNEQNRELNEKKDQLTVQETQITEFESEVDAKQKRIDGLIDKLHSETERSERYQSLIERQQTELYEFQDQTQQINQELAKEIDNREQIQNQLSNQAAQLIREVERTEELNSMISDLESRLEDAVVKDQGSSSSIQELEEKLRDAQIIIDRQRTELKALDEQIESQSRTVAATEEKGKYSEFLVAELEKELEEAKSDKARLQKVIDELVVKSNSQKESIRKLEESESTELSVLVEKQQRIEEENRKLKENLSKVQSIGDSDSKGTDSACWFRMKSNGDGSDSEHALYLFDIQISDDNVVVFYPSKSRNGSARNPNFDRDELDEIFDTIAFDRSVLGKPIDFAQFHQAFIGFRSAGHGKKVRSDQRCTFHVALWDNTSDKKGYQQAKEQVVDQIFYSYRYQDDPWPHG